MTPDERRRHMAGLGKRAAANRLTLSGDERDTLLRIYADARAILARHGLLDGEAAK